MTNEVNVPIHQILKRLLMEPVVCLSLESFELLHDPDLVAYIRWLVAYWCKNFFTTQHLLTIAVGCQ